MLLMSVLITSSKIPFGSNLSDKIKSSTYGLLNRILAPSTLPIAVILHSSFLCVFLIDSNNVVSKTKSPNPLFNKIAISFIYPFLKTKIGSYFFPAFLFFPGIFDKVRLKLFTYQNPSSSTILLHSSSKLLNELTLAILIIK